ncbi:uncharacterized protein LOC117572000 [Drosophila albomicans]|uniref:Uncharacterized protein LOC117572000 n=1 Tax=Drosophila albomicans TaxID=7291 RepID=A0A6P8XCN2_DROAB|nr:uncharacterized protein LOC117572000 [Drosophila albomicans]
MMPPNLGDCHRLWLRHEVNSDDTLTRLALKCGTTIGQLCRANRMHSQDIVQMRSHMWLPVSATAMKPAAESQQEDIPSQVKVAKLLPPHFHRQSVENLDDYAEESDPLLITTRCI